MARIADLKIWVRLTAAIWFMLIAVWTGMIVWESEVNRETAIGQAKDFAGSIHEMTMAGLTGMMITGTVGQREVFLDQIKQLSVIKDLHVVRGEAVSKIFGPDTKDKRPMDSIEQQAMQSGKAYTAVHEENGATYLRVVTPTLASTNYLGKNCIMCHQVPEGSVLGLVSMKVSLDKVDAEVNAFRLKIAAAAFGASLLLLAVIYLFIRHFVTIPIEHLTHGLQDIATGEGDLTRRLEVKGRDEVGLAATVFNQVMENFSTLVRQVSQSATEVSAKAHALAQSASQVADGSHQQNEKSVTAASAVEQMVSSIAAISQSAEHVQQQSQESLKRSEEGNKSLGHLLEEMNNVEQTVKEMAESVNEFVRNTDAINKMTQEVKDIAEQTNLLALNAAIEAARAGDQGRGFAVVADEVRALAHRTGQSTQEIELMIAAIQAGTDSVVKATALSTEEAGRTLGVAREAGAMLDNIAASVAIINERTVMIATAAEQQAQVAREVDRSLMAIRDLSIQSAAGADQTAVASDELARLATDLNHMALRFRT